jgi:phytanoyl-CoA hydroxylase
VWYRFASGAAEVRVIALAQCCENLDLNATLQALEEHGFVRLGRVLAADGCQALRQRAEDIMLGRVHYPGLFFQLDAPSGRYADAPIGLGWQGPSSEYRKIEKLELDPCFSDWLNNPLFERVVRGRISGDVALYRAILFNKGQGGGSEIPWHQDGGGLWGLSQMPELSIWTALDAAPVNGGCLEFVPGSHRLGLATPLGGVVPANVAEALGAEARAVPVPVEAGEAIALDNRVWHRSGRGRAGHPRLAFSACYMSGETRCLRKRRAPRSFLKVFG